MVAFGIDYAVYNKHVVFHEEGFQIPVPPHCPIYYKNANIFSVSLISFNATVTKARRNKYDQVLL